MGAAPTTVDEMAYWTEFVSEAPHISTVFRRRHQATGNLCMLGTLRKDGSPRISPVEPMIFADMLVIVGMPGTTKFQDLARDSRFCLHTATVDPMVGEGDVKLFGSVDDLTDRDIHARFAQWLFEDSGFDIRGQDFDHFFVADLTGASAVELRDDQLEVTIWNPGEGERVVRKR